jgi:hypothetical protein
MGVGGGEEGSAMMEDKVSTPENETYIWNDDDDENDDNDDNDDNDKECANR